MMQPALMPTFAGTVAAQFRFEWARRWPLLVLCLFGLAAIPLSRLARAPEDVLAATFGVALGGGLCALFGYDAVVARQNDRSVAFDLLQPAGSAGVLCGRVLFALAFGWLALVATALPGLLVSGRFESWTLQLAAAGPPVGLMIGVVLSAWLGTRDPFFVVHALPAGVVAVALSALAATAEAYGVEVVFATVALAAAAAGVVGLSWGWWAQLEKGRVDSVRGHRALAWRLWVPVVATLMGGGLLTWWAVTPPLERMREINGVSRIAEGNPWVSATLTAAERTRSPDQPWGLRSDYYRPYAIRVDGVDAGPIGLPADASRWGLVVPLAHSERLMWSSEEGLRWVDLDSSTSGIYPWQGKRPEQWALSPDGTRAVALFHIRAEGSAVPRWAVRQLDLQSGTWSADRRLVGVAERRYTPTFNWLRVQGESRPVLRLTAGTADGIAWFDFAGEEWRPYFEDQPPLGLVEYERLPRLSSSLRSPQVGGRVGVFHQHSLDGERTALADSFGILVVDSGGESLWQFEASKSYDMPTFPGFVGPPSSVNEPEADDPKKELENGQEKNDQVTGNLGAKVGDSSAWYYQYDVAWRRGALLVQTWRRTRAGEDGAARLGQLAEVRDGVITRVLQIPGRLAFGAALTEAEDQIAISWTEPPGSSSQRLRAGVLDLRQFEIVDQRAPEVTEAWVPRMPRLAGQEPWVDDRALIADWQSLYLLEHGAPDLLRLLEVGAPGV